MGLVEPERSRRYPFISQPRSTPLTITRSEGVTLGPPFIIGDEEIEAIGTALEAAIESVVEHVVAGSS